MARPRLERLADHIRPGGTALVVAPAGSGKTVLLNQWAARTADPVAWLSIHASHDDPVVLGRDIVGALDRCMVGFDTSIATRIPTGHSLGPAFIDAVVGELARIDSPLLLVLDDAHVLTQPEIGDDLGALLRRLPPPVRAVVASRWDPGFSFSSMRLDDVVEVRADDLAFRHDEAAALTTGVVGRELDDDVVGALVERTGGWSAGLQLASVSLRRSDDDLAFVERFAGDDRLIAEYLTAEVLRHEDEATRDFLLRTSVLDELTPELCDVVAGTSGAAATIDDLERRGLFVVDGARAGTRRYHHLFASLLRYRLRAEDPRHETRARQAAARWSLAHGDVRGAVEQLLSAGDPAAAFEIVTTHGHIVFARSEAATLVRWLTRISESGVEPRNDVEVNLLAAQIGADQFAAAEETYRRLRRVESLPAGHRAAAAAFHALCGMADLPIKQVKESTAEAFATVDEARHGPAVGVLGLDGPDTIEAMAAHMAGHIELFEGDVAGARATFEQALDLPGTRYPLWRVASLGALAVTESWHGRNRSAEAHAVAALELADEFDTQSHVSATMSHLAMSVVQLDRLETDDAAASLDAASRCAERSRRPFLHQLHALVSARHASITLGPGSATDLLRLVPSTGMERAVIRETRQDLLARMLVRDGRIGEARGVLEGEPFRLPLAHIDERLASGALEEAAALIEATSPDPANLRAATELEIRRGLVLDLRGERGRAGDRLTAALERADAEQLHAPFVEAPQALRILKTSASGRVAALVEGIAARRRIDLTRGTSNGTLIDPLTERELGVLEYLPSRLSNTEIAGTLYISVNTLKTHLRSIYRKLEVTDRDSAVDHATRVGLL